MFSFSLESLSNIQRISGGAENCSESLLVEWSQPTLAGVQVPTIGQKLECLTVFDYQKFQLAVMFLHHYISLFLHIIYFDHFANAILLFFSLREKSEIWSIFMGLLAGTLALQVHYICSGIFIWKYVFYCFLLTSFWAPFVEILKHLFLTFINSDTS